MSSTSAHVPTSSFVWYELLTSDAAAALSFYKQVLGWTDQDAGMPGSDYRLLSVESQMFGGLMTLPEDACAAGARPGWVGHIGVDDADAAVARLLSAGGQVLKPVTEIPGVGRFAVVADPQGVVFDVYQSFEAPPPPPAATEGLRPGVAWHELSTSDVAAATAFYAGQFGWQAGQALDMGPMGTYQLFQVGGTDVGGIMARPPEVPVSFWLFYFAVSDVSATIARAQAAGAQLLNGPMAVPGGAWVAQLLDPQGAPFAVVGALGATP